MSDITRGLFWHLHHDDLCEWSYDIEERVAYIQQYKPTHEIETRLRLLRPVVGPLPARLSKAIATCNTARVAYDTARVAYDRAGSAYDTARVTYNTARVAYNTARVAYDRAGSAYDRAGSAYDTARVTCNTARVAYEKARAAYRPELEALHAVECENCPWDGSSIFGGAE